MAIYTLKIYKKITLSD